MISRLLAALLALALVVAPGHAAIRSDGTDTQHLAGPYLSAVTRGAVTIMQWHKLNADANTRKILFNYHNNRDGGTFHNIILWTQGDGTTADLITVVGTPSRFQTSVQSITVGTWYHYAIVRNGSTIRLYVGSETAASTLITTLEDTSLAPQTSVWRFTATGSSGSGLSADASIERFKLYNAELTRAEINAERTSLGPSSTTNLWSYNPFTAAGSYGGTAGSNPMTFTEQGGANFSTVSGPSPVAGPSAQLGRHWQDRGDDVDLRGRRWWTSRPAPVSTWRPGPCAPRRPTVAPRRATIHAHALLSLAGAQAASERSCRGGPPGAGDQSTTARRRARAHAGRQLGWTQQMRPSGSSARRQGRSRRDVRIDNDLCLYSPGGAGVRDSASNGSRNTPPPSARSSSKSPSGVADEMTP